MHARARAPISHIYAKVRKDDFIKQLDFNATSIQTQRKSLTDFKFY